MPSPAGNLLHRYYERTVSPRHVFTRVGGLRYHHIWDPEPVRKILQDTEKYRQPSFVKLNLAQMIDIALIVDEGASHKNIHGLMKDLFTPGGVGHKIAPLLLRETDAMVDRWFDEKKPFDVEMDMRTLTGRTITQVMFGDSITEQQGLDIIHAATVEVNVVEPVPLRTLASRVFNRPRDILKTPSRELAAGLKKVDAIFDEILKERKRLHKQPDDILGRLLGARDYASGTPLTDTQIKGQLLMIVFAGHDTSSVTGTFELHEVLKNPAELEKLRRNAKSVAPDGNFAPSDVKALTAFRNALLETLRLYPPAYRLAREDQEDGALYRIDVQKMHHDPGLYPEPEKFRPDRFIEDPNPRAFIPFGLGAHQCLGRVMAETVLILSAAKIHARADIEVAEDIKGEKFGFTARPDGRMMVYARPR
jgi:cytochrome P450